MSRKRRGMGRFENKVFGCSELTLTGGADGNGLRYNLFKIIGAVEMFNIFGHVTVVMPATSSTINLELTSVNGSVDISDAAGGPDLTGRVVGTLFARMAPAGDPLDVAEPDGIPAVLENASYRDPKTPLTLVEDASADTYVQLVLTSALASGSIHWHIEYEPITDNGIVKNI